MKIGIGSDHGGYELKEYIKEYLEQQEIEYIDYGTDSFDSVDYPDYGLKLSKAVISVITLQYAVGFWNSYFQPMIYLHDDNLYPLQIFLREILVMSQMDAADYIDPETTVAIQGMRDLIKYALIVVSTVPILAVYPFIQKYFVQGIMIGSLKG